MSRGSPFRKKSYADKVSKNLIDTDPLRDELYSREHMIQHAKDIAGIYKSGFENSFECLLPRLSDNEKVLLETYELLNLANEANRRITPAGEWLLDNFYLIEEQIRTVRSHLSEEYSKGFPRLETGPFEGFPRIYHIAIELVSHSDGRIDEETLASFIKAYQSRVPLLLGELWAIPIVLRLALIENLRRIAGKISADRHDSDAADLWIDRMTEVARDNPKGLIPFIADMAQSDLPLTSAFVAEMALQLQGRAGSFAFALTWIEQRLSENNLTIEQMINRETQAQAVDQVSFGNSINSLRLLDLLDWKKFVEDVSLVEKILRSDPGDVYSTMDFGTRDRYRHVVEEISKKSGISECDVAEKAVDLARRNREEGERDSRKSHVGYFLVDKGRTVLENSLSYAPPLSDRLRRRIYSRALPLYFISIFLLILAALLFCRDGLPGYSPFIIIPVVLLLLFPVSQGAVTVVNWLYTLLVSPALLPKMDYSKGIPEDRKTVVVIPAVISGKGDVTDLLDSLEVRYLTNRDDNLYFALLTDLRNAPVRELPEDRELVDLLSAGIEDLNEKYRGDKPSTFFLMHRPRTWDACEGTWMGHERKRGILDAFNKLLSGKGAGPFSRITGDPEILSDVKYVITLDADTRLPPNSAKKLAGAMAHPLNRPVTDPADRVIKEGYGILQPRVALSLKESGISRFASIFGGEPGIDPYTHVVSDLYQDAFGEGSFIGKGIYDLKVFSGIFEGRFPEDLILSHDLLEGCYARTGFVSDVQVFEDYPDSYLSDMKRRHRWIRGDWQILQWLFPRVLDRSSKIQKNPLSLLSHWKIFDNLRRSLVPPAAFLFLIMAWISFPNPVFWTVFVATLYLIPPLIIACLDIIRKNPEETWSMHIRDIPSITMRRVSVPLLHLAFLPFEAYVSLDAILRSCFRMAGSHRHLLEWTTQCEVARESNSSLAGSYRVMWLCPAAGILLFALQVFGYVALFPAVWIFAYIWIFSPAIASWLSETGTAKVRELNNEQKIFLRALARKTWHFFEVFVTAEDHFLPPDNFQEQPVSVVAHRTSPTDIGLSLLANLTAYDFGYIPVTGLVGRTERTISTMTQLSRFKGHFYNWYDTLTLRPLLPRYISTVDSGNLVSHLLVLRQGLCELPDSKILSDGFADGLSDTLCLLCDAIENAEDGDDETNGYARSKIEEIRDGIKEIPGTAGEAAGHLSSLEKIASDLKDALEDHPGDEVRWWAGAVKREIASHLRDLELFASWNSDLIPPGDLASEVPGELLPHATRICTALEDLNGRIPTLREIAGIKESLQDDIDPLLEWLKDSPDRDSTHGTGRKYLSRILEKMESSCREANDLLQRISKLESECDDLSAIDYGFLYDEVSKLLAIGYNATDMKRDASFYDLLASEARITSYIGIARGKLPEEHWFALGRLLTNVDGGKPTLISWSGSMFEYLMPLLLMPTYENTLLDRTYHAVVGRQREYAKKRGVPWGISESCYNVTDTSLNYQYRAFGIPGLGFKRGLADDLVIAPYAGAMGLMVSPYQACSNLESMKSLGYCGDYGLFEAVDFTRSRTPPDRNFSIIRSFMAHHQGMSLLSLAYVLLDRPMQRRFMSDPGLKSAVMLLQEKMPGNVPFYPHTGEVEGVHKATEIPESVMRTFHTADTPYPEVHLLSNGSYHVMVNNSGSGYSRWKDLAVTRWRTDPTSDCSGIFCYIKDIGSGRFWSNGYLPIGNKPDSFRTTFRQAEVEFSRDDGDIFTKTEVIVSPEDDVELRRVWVTNRSWSSKRLEFTSYAEIVLAPQSADESHPAFSNLFVQTEILRGKNAILATRRPRSDGENPPWLFHLMTADTTGLGEVSFETDRMKFIGRGNSPENPSAMTGKAQLSGTAGPVLDPVAAVRCTIRLNPQETVCVNIFTGISGTRDGALSLVDKYYDPNLTDRVFELAWTHAQVMLRQLDITEQDAQVCGALASSVIYSNPLRRTDRKVIMRNAKGQSDLWRYGISGDLPIVLVTIGDRKRIGLVRDAVRAHSYWHVKGLTVDLVILNEEESGYRQEMYDEIVGTIPFGPDSQMLNARGGIFILSLELMPDEDVALIRAAACAVISDRGGSLASQVEGTGWCEIRVPDLNKTRDPSHESFDLISNSGGGLIYFNGTGGFSPDGKEYIIFTGKGQTTPAPWVNVLANENFGSVISERGSAYTWYENSHEFRLTPWMNDPVRDTSGEALYIRDEETGAFWSPSSWPVKGSNSYVTRHGFGYSVFEYFCQEIGSELTVHVSPDSSVKYMSLRLKNRSGRKRSLSVTGYVEWVLGELRSRTLPHVVTKIDPVSGAVFARNSYNYEFPGKVAFLDSNIIKRTITGDRHEFIGRNGSIERPAAMERADLSNKTGAALDPCAAIKVPCELAAGEEREIIFTLGAGDDIDEARELVLKNRGVGPARASLKAVKEYWEKTLGAVRIKTPDESLDLFVNGWLVYQVIASRMWARSGFYQSGGAFGFRDQLQDAMALIHTRPEILRKQILLCAEHQFEEGDVQHWWHPPANRGVRTHCSDDYLWLPFAVCRYVSGTGDSGVLDEEVSFLKGRELSPGEESCYDLPEVSEFSATLYEHCLRAIKRGLGFGVHGLPLMGTGDWNDGMNLVGAGGKGESVWLGFFTYDLLKKFGRIAEMRGDKAFAGICRENSETLRMNLDKEGWDGRWYRRAYYDSGRPLGSAGSKECMIDSIAQSWAVFSGAAPWDRAAVAMESVKENLVLWDEHLIPLLTPPFDKTPDNPGYIKGYLPGVRENGGHYSQAAVWVVGAFARLKDNRQAWRLLQFVNPVSHGRTPEDAARYRVEPYVMASDIYAGLPHTGRGGWTWYSGSAGHMYTLILESLLGLRLSGGCLEFDPCVPEEWDTYTIDYRYLSTEYHITIRNKGKGCTVRSVSVDRSIQEDMKVRLVDDEKEHEVLVELEN